MPDGNQSSPYYWNIDRIMKLLLTLALVLVVSWLLSRLSDVLLPFFAACLIAYLLNPLVELNQSRLKLKCHALAVCISLTEVAIVATALIIALLPLVVSEVNTLATLIDNYQQASTEAESHLVPESLKGLLKDFNTSRLATLVSENTDGIFSRGRSLIELIADVLMRTIEWLLMFIYIIFILLDYNQIVNGFKKIIPYKYRAKSMVIVGEVELLMSHYFRGQGLLALCAMVLYCIGFSLVGMPLAIVMGITVGLLYMIPYFQYITLIPVAIICIITSLGGDIGFWSMFGKCCLVYAVSQSVCDYILTPHIMGKELGLNPAVILLALSVWGSLLGILGMIIALPATALLMAYYERYISDRGAATPADPTVLQNIHHPKKHR